MINNIHRFFSVSPKTLEFYMNNIRSFDILSILYGTLFIIILGVSTRSHSLIKRFAGIYPGPYFDESSPKNCTAQLGTSAFLPCRVRQLGNKSVRKK